MTLNEFLKFYDQCDEWIRTAQIERAQKVLQEIRVEEVPASRLRDLCSLYRRTHLWKLSLSALKPRIRPQVDLGTPASPGEKIEYALALQKEGAYRESQNLLSEPDVRGEPQAILARAFYEIFHWNYPAAEPLLAEYIASDKITDYERLIASVNHLACLRYIESPALFSKYENLKTQLIGSGNQRLLSAVLEIGSQHFIAQEQWKEARGVLTQAESILGTNNAESVFVEKWRAISAALETKEVGPLDFFRQKALASKSWETLRDLDYFRATLEPTSQWASWVYYGTPHASFRKRLDRFHSFPEQKVVSRSGNPTIIIDPWFVGDQHGETIHLLFNLLLRDFYRPIKVGEIFSELFWDGYHDVKSSQDRVHQVIKRLRQWITKNNLPFVLHEMSGAYSLRMDAQVGLTCHRRILPVQKLPFIFGRYYMEKNAALSAQEWAERLNVTTTKARNLLTQAIPEGLISKTGAGQQTRYKIDSN